MPDIGPMFARPAPVLRETSDYPGLWVDDDRRGGAITIDRSRLPVNVVAASAAAYGWSDVADDWSIESDYNSDGVIDSGWLAGFVLDLLDHPGAFGRLLCVLADVNRVDRRRTRGGWWIDYPRHRQRVREALQACLDALDWHDRDADG